MNPFDKLTPDQILISALRTAQAAAKIALYSRGEAIAQVSLFDTSTHECRTFVSEDFRKLRETARKQWRPGEIVFGSYGGTYNDGIPVILVFAELPTGQLRAQYAFVQGTDLGDWVEADATWSERLLAGRLN